MKNLLDSINKLSNHEENILTEAQNYAAMFNPLWTMVSKITVTDPGVQAKLENNINLTKAKSKEFTDMAKSSLKKNDRIVWFLKLVRITLCSQLMVETNLALYRDDDPRYNASKENQNDELAQYAIKEQSTFSPHLQTILAYQQLTRLITALEHALSLPIPEIQNTVFTNQNPNDLLGIFQDLEKDWKDKQNQIVDIKDDTNSTIVLKFPDGKMWFDLGVPFCEREGKAMGHCGNKAAYQDNDTVLSLREPIKQGNETKWRPLLTFILHHGGNLGEMKGRGNQKPSPQYHNYIIELLKLPLIKGIVGGGYAPERNFALTDLPQQEQDELVELKPSLGTLAYQFNRFGMTEDILQQIKDKADSLGIRADMKSALQYDKPNNMFIADELPLANFIDNCTEAYNRRHADNALSYAYGICVGDQFVEAYEWVSKDNVENLIAHLPSDLEKGLLRYCFKNYPEAFNVDETLEGDMYDLLKENDDEILDEFRRAVSSGYESATYNEIYNALTKCLKNWEAFGFSLQFKTSDDGEHIIIDEPVKLVISAKNLIDNLSNDDYCEMATDASYWLSRDYGPRLKEPRDGWSDYSEADAIAYLRYNLNGDQDLEKLAKEEDKEAKESIDYLKTKI